MRQVEFKNHKGEEFLFVNLLKGAKCWINETYHTNTLWYKLDEMRNPKHINLPKTQYNYKLISTLSEMTEELWKGVVDLHEHGTAYKKYNRLWTDRCSTAKESGESLLQSLQIYMVNPYGEIPNVEENYDLYKWQQA